MTEIEGYLVPASPCPGCGVNLDIAQSPGGAPLPGDVGLCHYCQTVMVFEDDLTCRLPHPGELDEDHAGVGQRLRELRQ